MDTPELTDELIDTIAAQSDEQSGAYDVRQLERIRDSTWPPSCSPSSRTRWGAGTTIAALR